MSSESDPTDYMSVIRYGEDLLTEIMARIGEMMIMSKSIGIPVDRSQLTFFSKRFQPGLEDQLKFFPVLLKRLRMTEDILLERVDVNDTNAPVEEIIPLRDDPVGALPVTFEEEMRSNVRPELWKEYVDLKDKLCKRDAYIKTIINSERAILQEINCVVNP